MAGKPRELLRAQALRELKTAEQLNSQLSDEEREQYYILTLALFAGAVGHRLGEDPTRDEIDRLVSELRHDYRNAEPKVNFLAVEALIRALYGEDHLIDDLGQREQYLAQLPVIAKIVAQSAHMRDRIDDYLTDAETLAAHWQSQE